jgi:hypothetical protein
VKGNKMRPFKLCFGKTLTFAEMLRGYFKWRNQLGMLVHSRNPGSRETRQEYGEFQSSLGYVGRFCLTNKQKWQQ